MKEPSQVIESRWYPDQFRHVNNLSRFETIAADIPALELGGGLRRKEDSNQYVRIWAGYPPGPPLDSEKNGMRLGFRDDNDMRSLQIREEEHNLDDGIRLLEAEDPSGKGFALIDDTHEATRYNLKLATVVVADVKDRGLPAAFLLSGTMTTADVGKFFSRIKEVLPEFDPKQVVTDEAPCFFKGFRTVILN
ncbi:unnamed protein product [Nippostrongylus brasiliensis]|uniref:Transposase n=1 Tax=Nippostrongylus brasiliensis TaxID=27835 RepID=A0A0N4YU17_NIPBR|nr:unnamed protein product [Nippostrongylus brasiliensis]